MNSQKKWYITSILLLIVLVVLVGFTFYAESVKNVKPGQSIGNQNTVVQK